MSRRIRLDVTVPLDRFPLELRWETSADSLGVFGPSGAGKTTILETIAGLRRSARGVIQVDDQVWLDSHRGIDVPTHLRGVGYVPQDALLFPHQDVMGNLLMGAGRAGAPRAARIDPQSVLEVLELADLKDRSVTSLSGGERQRVALGRALCSNPDLLLLDEPLAGLDLPLRRRILLYLIRVHRMFGVPTLCVSHDATEIRALSREVTVIRSGRVVAQGAPEIVFTEGSVLTMARDAGIENVLRGRATRLEDAAATVDLEPGLSILVPGAGVEPGSEVLLAVRAEDLILAKGTPAGLSAQNVIPGVIREIREEGGDGQVIVIVDPGRTLAPLVVTVTWHARRQLALAPGAPVQLICKAQACRVLAAS